MLKYACDNFEESGVLYCMAFRDQIESFRLVGWQFGPWELGD